VAAGRSLVTPAELYKSPVEVNGVFDIIDRLRRDRTCMGVSQDTKGCFCFLVLVYRSLLNVRSSYLSFSSYTVYWATSSN